MTQSPVPSSGQTRRRIVLLTEGSFGVISSKTAVGVIRYSPHEVVAVLDSEHAGKTVQDVLGFGGSIPIVSSIAEAMAFNPDVALIGIAPAGGKLPDAWRRIVSDAIDAHLEVWSGMHAFLSDDPEFAQQAERKGVRLWDVRRPPASLGVATAAALKTRAFVVLAVGSDCNVGKMTVSLELQKYASEKGYKTAFVATGQTGILIAGDGTPLDAIPGDFMSGEVERLVVAADQAGADVIFVEGQGSIVHPGFGAVTLALMLGSMADAYVLCHLPTRATFRPDYDIPLPPLPVVVRQYETLMEYHKAPKVRCVALNTFNLSDEDSRKIIEDTEALLGLPTTDPIRYGVDRMWAALEPLVRQKLGR